MGTEWLRKIGASIGGKQNRMFNYPVEKQKAYIARFPQPKDGFERGYFHYCCQMKLYGQPLHFFMNLAALPLSLYYLLTYKSAGKAGEETADAVFFHDGKPFNIIPDSLQARYAKIVSSAGDGKALTKEDRKFLNRIFRKYPVSWMLWLKVIIKVAQYSYAITKYNPKAIICCSEYAYTGPFLTEYCHTRGVKLINVMHGEKMYYMRDSFAHYDEFYVWDQHYVDLLTEEGARQDQFLVELPGSMRICKQADIPVQYDYTYYLQDESKETLQVIANALQSLHAQGKRISVRPHPRFSDPVLVKALFPFANMEDCKAVSIEQSLQQTGAVVSLFSTVLNQAVNSGIHIVIDDVSQKAHFEKLKQLRFICLYKEHQLLSEIVSKTH